MSSKPTLHSSGPFDLTVLSALAGSAVVAAAVIALLWPRPVPTAGESAALSTFNDDISGEATLVIDLGAVALADLPQDASATLEIVLRAPASAENHPIQAGLTLLVQATKPLLTDAPTTMTLDVGGVGGPLAVRRIEVHDGGWTFSGLHSALPWGLVIGLASGAPASLQMAEDHIVFPPVTQQRVLTALRRLRDQGYRFDTFEIDMVTGEPRQMPPSSQQPSSEAPLP